MRDFLLQTGALAGVPVLFLGVAVGAATPHADQVAVLFPPWWSTARVVAAAAGAGRIVALGRLPATVIVRGEAASLSTDLRAAGGLLLVDASGATGCRAPASEVAP